MSAVNRRFMFCLSVLRAFEEADANADKKIELIELATYVQETRPELSQRI